MVKNRFKKFMAIAAAVAVAFAMTMTMTGCAEPQQADIPEEDVDYEIALVTDDGLIMDGGHSEVAWNTLIEFGATNGMSHKYYKAAEPTTGAFVETIKTAISKGAKIVIVDNSTMQEAVYKMQEKYPEIKFVIIDSEPYDPQTGDVKIKSNTAAASFDSSQAGFLAGYAAVIDGYTNLGFIGQSESMEIKGFGYGYVKGAKRAAEETGAALNIKYEYASDTDHETVSDMAAAMYKDGTEVIFAAGGNIQDAVIEAAEAADGKVIGSITDQSAKSDKVITSAIYNIDTALKGILKEYKDKEFPGGEVVEYNARNEGIGLELRNNRLETITQKQYDTVYDGLAKGEIKIRVGKDSVPNL